MSSMPARRRLLGATAACASLAALGAAGRSSAAPCAVAAGFPRYRVADIGDLGGDNVRVADLNSHGLSTGMANRKTDDNRGVAFLARGTRMRGLPPVGPGSPSYGTGVNDAGWACGFDGTNGVRRPARAWLYQGGERSDLPAGPGEHSFAFALNAAAMVTGSVGDDAFVYRHADGQLERLALPPGFTAAQGRDVRDDGVVVGEMLGPAGRRAFVWTGRVAEALGIAGAAEDRAAALNRAGTVCGTLREINGDALDRAFVWQEGRTLRLGSLGDEGGASQALALNDAGWVVGRAARPGKAPGRVMQCAFVWQAGVMADLNLLMDPSSDPDWHLSTAVAINRHGQIVGQGRWRGERRSWIATPLA